MPISIKSNKHRRACVFSVRECEKAIHSMKILDTLYKKYNVPVRSVFIRKQLEAQGIRFDMITMYHLAILGFVVFRRGVIPVVKSNGKSFYRYENFWIPGEKVGCTTNDYIAQYNKFVRDYKNKRERLKNGKKPENSLDNEENFFMDSK